MIATRLRELRLSQALSMRDLSRRSGVSPATMVRAEKGEPIYPVTVRRLAKALGVTPAALAGPAAGDDEPRADGLRYGLHDADVIRVPESRRAALAILLEKAERCRTLGDLAGAARWERHADELLSERDARADAGSVE